MRTADILIKDVEIFNVYLKKFMPADVYVLGKKIYYIDWVTFRTPDNAPPRAALRIDGQHYRMLPGFVDIHMHIESSMMTPLSFGMRAAQCGVTTLVSEPHEIANAAGLQGIHEMINAAKDSPIDIYYGIPSSVPSTNDALETTGGKIGFDEMKRLMREDGVVCVGEIMNYRQIINGENLEITRFLDYLEEENPQAVIEGHCPSLVGEELARFLYRGIDADHTEHTLAEIKERFANGMFVELQEKMLKPEILAYIMENELYEHCCFVTDDTMADELKKNGQLNHIVRKAVSMGFPYEMAVYCASFTPSRRMNLRDRGALAPGKKADFQLIKKTEALQFEPDFVFKDGKQIFEKAQSSDNYQPYEFPASFYQSVRIKEITLQNLNPFVDAPDGKRKVRVMTVRNGCTQTKEQLVEMEIKNNRLLWENSGCMLVTVFERYGKNGNIAHGFVTGDCLKTGAVATTYYHDHHNLMIMGANLSDMLCAGQRLLKLQGGICTAGQGELTSELPLPICGIISQLPADEIGTKLGLVRAQLEEMGYHHSNPIMSLCTLGLPVSPALKLTDCGLVDVKGGKLVSLLC